MSFFAPSTALRLVDSLAIALSQAYQVARVRLASADSPVLRLLVQRDHAVGEVELLRRELAIFRNQREQAPPHQRREYSPQQRLAILQLKRLRNWTLGQTAERFVLHENTVRCWIHALEGDSESRLFTGALVWNKLDDAVRWAVHELQRLCPEPEFGTRSLARQLVKAAIQISRSSVQRILRDPEPEKPKAPQVDRHILAEPAGVPPHHLLRPKGSNHVWHMDLTQVQILWWTFWIAAVLDGYSRKLLALRIYRRTPKARDMFFLVRHALRQFGRPRFLITDHGSQFRRRFHEQVEGWGVHHVRNRVRTPYLNGKMERAFRTFKLWWRCVLTGCTLRSLQQRLDAYRHWYNTQRIHSALGVLTPQEAWDGMAAPRPVSYLACQQPKLHIRIVRSKCRGDPRLRVLHISVRQAA